MENNQNETVSKKETSDTESSTQLKDRKNFKPFHKKKYPFKNKKTNFIQPKPLDFQEEEFISKESLSNKKNYHFFQSIQNYYLEDSKFINYIEEFLQHESINDLIFLEKNLLIYCCLNNNEKAFDILLPYYLKSEEKNNILYQCLFFLLPNKNPNILEKCLKNINHLDDDKMNNLLNFFAKNCYRKENCLYFIQWLEKKEILVHRFISELFEYNNISFLKQLKEINFDILKKYQNNLVIDSFNIYQKSSFHQIFNIRPIVQNTPTVIENLSKNEPQIIIKRKRKEITI
jgi:hypothetical protein